MGGLMADTWTKVTEVLRLRDRVYNTIKCMSS